MIVPHLAALRADFHTPSLTSGHDGFTFTLVPFTGKQGIRAGGRIYKILRGNKRFGRTGPCQKKGEHGTQLWGWEVSTLPPVPGTFSTFLICKCWQNLSFRIYTRFHHLPSSTARGLAWLTHPPFYADLCPFGLKKVASLHPLSFNVSLTKPSCEGLQLFDQKCPHPPPLWAAALIPHCWLIPKMGTTDRELAPLHQDSWFWLLSNYRQGQSSKKYKGVNNWKNTHGKKTSKFAYASKSLITYSEEGFEEVWGEMKSSGEWNLLKHMTPLTASCIWWVWMFHCKRQCRR